MKTVVGGAVMEVCGTSKW